MQGPRAYVGMDFFLNNRPRTPILTIQAPLLAFKDVGPRVHGHSPKGHKSRPET